MLQTPFHAYYTAMKLSHLQDEDKLLPVYSENTISVYPYQVAAALFAMRSPYQSGVILCDEAGMEKLMRLCSFYLSAIMRANAELWLLFLIWNCLCSGLKLLIINTVSRLP